MEGEVIFIRLTDVGRKRDLKRVINIIPTIPYKKVVKTKDSPYYLDFPESLNLKVNQDFNSESENIDSINLQVKLYEDGVI